MISLTQSGRSHRRAVIALMLSALPLSLTAQVRRPDPVPANGSRASGATPKTRTEFLIGGGTIGLNEANATKGSMPILSAGFRTQFMKEWLFIGGVVDAGRTSVNGEFFPYERRPDGDSVQFFAVGGNATMIAGRVTADVLWPLDEAEKYRAGFGLNLGMYAMMPSPAGGEGAGTIVAPTFGAGFVGAGDITAKFGFMASLGFTQFTGFDRDKLRPSDPALADPVFTTPFVAPPDGVKSFGGPRLVVGLTYRLGVKKSPTTRK
jgi:hypothetical protein